MATFQLSSAASLNLGRSQNGVLENGLSVLLIEFDSIFLISSISYFMFISILNLQKQSTAFYHKTTLVFNVK